MPARNSGESLYNYCNRLINSNIQSDINWGKQLLSEWNYVVNSSIGIDINTVSKGSRTEAFWVCSNGHSFKKSIVSRTGKDDKHRDKCRICAYNIRAQKTRERALKRNTLRDWCNRNSFGNIILREFDTRRNEEELNITLDNIPPFSETYVYWICNNGHNYKALLNNRTSHMTGCPYCKGSGTSYFEQLLYFIFKSIYSNAISRGKVYCNKNGVEFDIAVPELKLCIEYGNDYTHPNSIESELKRKLCIDNKVDLCYIHSSNTKQEVWSREQIVFKQNWNNCIDDAIKLVGYILSVRGIDASVLNYLDYEYISVMAYEYSHGEINFEDSLAYYDSELCKEWDYNRNRTKPENYRKFSNKKVWWKCKVCGHSWQATILNRSYNRSGCPNCAGKV